MAETVTIGGKTYTKPENAQAGWLAEARKAEKAGTMEAIKNLPQYQDLLNKGYKADDIEKAVAGYKPPTPQVQQQEEIKPATPETKVEQVQPQQQEKTQEFSPTPDRPLQPLSVSEYQDDTMARQNQIVGNLNEYRNTAPQYFKDIDTYRKVFSYGMRSDTQKELLDNRYLGYQKGNELKMQTNQSLSQQYLAGTLTVSDLNILRDADPNRYNEVMGLINKQTTLQEYHNQLNPQEATNPFQAIIDNYVSGLASFSENTTIFQEYKDQINSPAMKEQIQQINESQKEMEELQLLINNKHKEVEKRYEGTGATRGKIQAIVADETYDLQLQMSNKGVALNSLVNNYNSQMQTIQQGLQLEMQEQQFNMQQRNQQMSELGFAMQLMSFETPQQQDERAWNNFIRQQEYVDGNIYSSDPATRRKAISNAVDGILKEFAGIPMLRSREQMIQDIQNLVDSGMDLGEALTKNLREPIMNKDEYKSMISQQFGTGVPNIVEIGGKPYQRSKDSQSFIPVSIYDGPTGMTEFIGKREGFRENAYQDVGGAWTIGYGFTSIDGRPVQKGDKITREQADVEFQKQISRYQNWRNYITVPLSEAQETALTSFEYNLGQGIWTKTGGTGAMGVIDKINAGDLQGAADLMKKFNTVKGTVVQGLTNRRNDEASLIIQPAGVVGGGAGFNTSNTSSFQSFLDGDRKPAVFGGSQAERQQSLQDMGYSSWTEFYRDFDAWEKQQVETPSPIFVSAAKFIKDNPLFDYTDDKGTKHKGILGTPGSVDTKLIAKIESNLAQGKAWDSGTAGHLAINIGQRAKVGQFINAFETIKSSKVIDIVKTGKVKLYPMSDADIKLLGDSTGFKLGNLTIPDTANEISIALSNLGSAYSTGKGDVGGQIQQSQQSWIEKYSYPMNSFGVVGVGTGFATSDRVNRLYNLQ